MEKEKLIITVSGRTRSGKSHLSFLLNKFLRENGFDVKHEVSLDYQNESQFKRQMSKNYDEVINLIKEQREILIKEVQLKYDYFDIGKESKKKKGEKSDKKLHISGVSGSSIPKPPEPPLSRVLREGVEHFCTNCGSTVSRSGFLGIFGEMLCHNQKCPNSKSKKNYR